MRDLQFFLMNEVVNPHQHGLIQFYFKSSLSKITLMVMIIARDICENTAIVTPTCPDLI